MKHPITAYREANGLSLEQFGALLNVNRSVVLKWERGALPRRETLVRIETATSNEVTAEALIRWQMPTKEAA